MLNTTITNFRRDIFSIMERTIKYNEPINVTTKEGNAVILSEDDYNGLMETIYISANPATKSEIIAGLKTKIKDCIPESEIDL